MYFFLSFPAQLHRHSVDTHINAILAILQKYLSRHHEAENDLRMNSKDAKVNDVCLESLIERTFDLSLIYAFVHYRPRVVGNFLRDVNENPT